jgi:hypothetical protein
MWAKQSTCYMRVGLRSPASVNKSCHRRSALFPWRVARTAKKNATYVIVNVNKIKFHSWRIILLARYIGKQWKRKIELCCSLCSVFKSSLAKICVLESSDDWLVPWNIKVVWRALASPLFFIRQVAQHQRSYALVTMYKYAKCPTKKCI